MDHGARRMTWAEGDIAWRKGKTLRRANLAGQGQAGQSTMQ